jgi:DNA polymerase-1
MSARPRGGPGSLFLLDANNLLFRAYHGLPPLTAPDGTPVNAVHGYVRLVQAVRRAFSPQFIAAVFDAPGPGFRNRDYPAYKANRPPPPDDLIPQFDLVRGATRALGVPLVEVPDYEADDLIASYAIAGHDAGLEVIIVSSDKDLMQLVATPADAAHPPIRLWDSMKERLIGPDEVLEKWGVRPDKLGDLLALTGDSVDNVPGVPGIGPKTAAALLDEYGTLEGVLAAAPALKQKARREKLMAHADDARLSRRLVELVRDAPLPLTIDALADRGPDGDEVQRFFAPLGFKSVLAGLTAAGRDVPAAVSGSKAKIVLVDATASSLEPADDASRAALDAVPAVEVQVSLAGDEATLAAWVAAATATRRPSAWGFELDGSDPMRATMTSITVYVPGVGAMHIPTHVADLADVSRPMAWDDAMSSLRAWLEDAGAPKTIYDAKTAEVALAERGVTLAGVVIDPMLVSYTLDPARSSHELDVLARELLGQDLPSLAAPTAARGRGKKAAPAAGPSVAEVAGVAGPRVGRLHALGEHCGALVARASEPIRALYRDMELPLSHVLANMERRGVLLDVDAFRAQAESIARELATLRARIEDDAGHPINPESPLQLQKLLFEERGLPAGKKTKTGYSVDAATLEELSMLDPIVSVILEHRSLTKLKGTYLDSFPGLVHPRTRRLHTSYKQAVAQTGRLSSVDPNLQNIPIRTTAGMRIREGFIAPRGRVLVTLDYSQIELRILAHLSGDPAFCAAFREGDDVHRRTAAEVFECPREAVTSEQRRVAKAVNFGVIYGQTAFGLSRQLGVPQGRAAKYIKSYFEKIPGVAAYLEELVQRASRQGFAETLLGRRRRIPELAAKGAARGYGERIARNTPIQGSAADILKIAMVRVEAQLLDIPWAQMILTVHDELIFECDEARVDDLVAIVQPVMEHAVELTVPLEIDAGVGRTWAEAKR